MTDDNDPLFEKSQAVWDALDAASGAVDLIDNAILCILKRKNEIGYAHRNLEYDHLQQYHVMLDRVRNDLAYENALLAEQYGHPDWQTDKED